MAEKIVLLKMEGSLKKAKKRLEKLKKKEAWTRKKWTDGYQGYRKAAKDLATLTRHGTKKEKKLREIILGWDDKTVELTKGRDKARKAIRQEEEKVIQLRIQYAELLKETEAEIKANDEIVKQAFSLSLGAAESFEKRNTYLNEHAYPRLVSKDGNLRSQITLDHSDGRTRVVVMTNTITIVDSYLAAEAKSHIEEFFLEFQSQVEIDGLTQKLFELTRNLLIEKTKFKIGPDLYLFLSMDMDAELFPGLAEAQRLLKLSLRSEKTSSYIRLYQRESRTNPWKRIKMF